jgi:peptidyl-prolyl cis-trans isomerase SurA
MARRSRTWNYTSLAFLGLGVVVCVFPISLACAQNSPGITPSPQSAPAAPAQQPTPPPGSHATVLDRVIAIINGDVLLESDVQEEMDFGALQPLIVQPGQNEKQRAAERLINRTLILQQMRDQNMDTPVAAQDVAESLKDLRKQIPACARFHCDTQAGWKAFLAKNNLTEDEVEQRWEQRLRILKYIDSRFRAGIRITKPEIEKYYQQTLVPAFEKENARQPALASISPRIEEILLQQHVNLLLRDWLHSLRDQGSVQILDPAYGQISSGGDDSEGGA